MARSGDHLGQFAMAGELALDGSLRPIRGALAMAMSAVACGIPNLVVPAASAREIVNECRDRYSAKNGGS